MISKNKTFFLKNARWATKNAKFDPDFESVEKVAKRLMRKKL